SKVQYERVLGYIDAGKQDGARLIAGGKRPSDPHLASGFYVEPTVFADVTMDMRIAKEEIFGPVLSILKWSDEDKMLAQVNQVEYGLTCSIWTNDLATAHRAAAAVEVGPSHVPVDIGSVGPRGRELGNFRVIRSEVAHRIGCARVTRERKGLAAAAAEVEPPTGAGGARPLDRKGH